METEKKERGIYFKEMIQLSPRQSMSGKWTRDDESKAETSHIILFSRGVYRESF